MQASMNWKDYPFVLLLFATILLLFALALLPIVNVDFQGKVLFGLQMNKVVWIIPFFLMSFWLLYLATRKFLYSTAIAWIHVLTTVIASLVILAVLYIGLVHSQLASGNYELTGKVIQIASVIFVCGQFFYFINIGLGILGKHKA